jgi:hypothetical protein
MRIPFGNIYIYISINLYIGINNNTIEFYIYLVQLRRIQLILDYLIIDVHFYVNSVFLIKQINDRIVIEKKILIFNEYIKKASV